MTTPLLTATALHRRYGHPKTGFEAVRGIDLEVAPGEFFALLGTNGAGKTSTMELLEGMASPTSGVVRIAGLDPFADRRRLRPHIGVVLQNAGFSGDLTVTETARMWAGTMSEPRPVDEALALVDMLDRRNVAVQSLSGGERRRLDLALAVMGRPGLLFLDEPTTGLDPESRHRAWDVLARLLDAGTAIVLTTHYLEEAERLADRIAIMHEGRIATTGTLAQIVADQPSTISFRTPAGRAMPEFRGVHVVHDGPHTRISTPELQPTLAAVLAWAGDDIVLDDLRASAASLEQAFLSFAGTDATPTQQQAAA